MAWKALLRMIHGAHRGGRRAVQALAGLTVGAVSLVALQSPAGAQAAPTPTGSAAVVAAPSTSPAVDPSPTEAVPTTPAVSEEPTPKSTAPADPAPVPSAPAPSVPAKAAPKKAAAETCGGAFLIGTVVSCPEIAVGTEHVYTVTTTIADEDLRVRFSAATATGADGDAYLIIKAPDGTQICTFGSDEGCVATTVGVYTLTVQADTQSGSESYRLGVQSFSNPQSCTALPGDSFAFPLKHRPGTLPEDSAGQCHSFDQPAGALLRLSVTTRGNLRGTVVDAVGTTVCGLDYDIDCRLTGTGPYRIVFASLGGWGDDYGFWAVRVSDPTGCAKLSPAEFGGPGDAAGSLTLDSSSLGCQTFTAEAGPHLLTFGANHYVDFRLVDDTGEQVCTGSSERTTDCDLPSAGTYALITKNNSADQYTFRAAVYPLASTRGCGDEIATTWSTPPTRVTMTSDLQVDCHPINAAPGDRVRVDAPNGWLTDGSGKRICEPLQDEDNEGCPLPGAGPYRVVSAGYWDEDSSVHPYDIAVVRLNGREDCTAVAVGRYGAAPAGPPTTNRCRTLTVAAAGTYQVGLVDDENNEGYGDVYDSAGLRVCSSHCTFPEAGTYTLVAAQERRYATVFLPATGTDGCLPVSDAPLTAPRAGEFTVAGEKDCLLLPTPTGARLTLVRPQDSTGTGHPEVAVYDADGVYQCDIYQLRDYSCVLDGRAPYRAILHLDSDTDDVAGPYNLGFVRTGGASGCPVLPKGSFGSTATTPVTLGGTGYVGCLSIPDGQHSAVESITFRRTAGSGLARISVFGADGGRSCQRAKSDAGLVICRLDPGPATVLVEGTAASGTYALARRDLTGAATGCRTITDTTVGAPSVAGTLTSAGDLHCYQVTAAQADRLAIDSRDPALQTRALVLGADGAEAGCSGLVSGCSVTGSTKYQVLVFGYAPGSTAYQLDVWKVWADGKPPAECPAVPSIAYGFGPYTGILTNAKPAACFVANRTRFDDLSIELTNPVDPDDAFYWNAGVYAISATGMQSCAIGDGGWHCQYNSRERAERTVYLLTNGNRVTDHPYRMTATCERPLCGGETYTATSVAPASVPNQGAQVVTVKGTALHRQDTVHVTPAGREPVATTVKAVSADRTTMTVEVDLASAPAGPATVTVRPHADGLAPVVLTGALTVTLQPLKATKAPSIAGTAAVGSTLKAAVGGWTPTPTSYTYQWSANGVAIKGATASALSVPAGVLGKRLTVTVTASLAGHPSASASSAASKTVAKGTAPKATKRPSITGTAKVGRTVKVAAGSWTPRPDSYRYEWRLNGVLIRGATGSSLKLTSSMRNKKLTVTVIARKTGFTDGNAVSKVVTVRR
jgi:hypothetical protein